MKRPTKPTKIKHGAEPSEKTSTSSAHPVYWVFQHRMSGRQCKVQEQTWYKARALAATELRCPPEELEVQAARSEEAPLLQFIASSRPASSG
jgi:hypothetical protein